MRTKTISTIALSALLVSGAAAVAQDQQQAQKQEAQQDKAKTCTMCGQSTAAGTGASGATAAAPSASEAIAGWPETPRQVAMKTIEKYGQPSGVTPSRLIWDKPQNGPWSEIILSREEVQHDFPMKHTDVLEQVIPYEVPPDKLEALAKFDGSVIVERTKGTMSARCDKEAANFLALNLAHDIVTGKKDVEQARRAYAEAIQQSMKGEMPTTMQKLTFEPKSKEQTGDADKAVIKKS